MRSEKEREKRKREREEKERNRNRKREIERKKERIKRNKNSQGQYYKHRWNMKQVDWLAGDVKIFIDNNTWQFDVSQLAPLREFFVNVSAAMKR